jgi:predicted dehydrogenase
MDKDSLSRRDFIRLGAGATALTAAKVTLLEPSPLGASPRAVPPSDTVRFGCIGTGTRGGELLQASLRVPGIECVAVCDLYDSRHQAAREYLKKDVPATREYREVLDRKDIDAVIVAVTDHWHRKIVEDACAAGKDVYCEKPLSHTVEDGFAIVNAVQKNNRVLQVGSQRVSSILYAKAKEIYASGKLGDVSAIEAYWDRNSDSGAWVYPIPPDASEQTIDWNRFLGGAPKVPYDPKRFFRWRCYKDYGEGLAGDLFVHLISGIHFITSANMIPHRATSEGGLFHFKDGREFPDLITTFYEYPQFRTCLRCNLNNEGGEFIAFYGKKGTMIIKDATLTYTPQDTRPKPEGYSLIGWPRKLREQYLAEWREQNPLPQPGNFSVEEETEVFAPPSGYSDVPEHIANFFDSVRTRKSPVENEVFGNNAALGCHLSNYAYDRKTVAVWDGAAKRIRSA